MEADQYLTNEIITKAGRGRRRHGIGTTLDADANAGGRTPISQPGRRPRLYVVPTDEELMCARRTLAPPADASAAP